MIRHYLANANRRLPIAQIVGSIALFFCEPAVAQQTEFPCDTAKDPARCGEVSPLFAMHSTEAVHMGLVWKKHSQQPKILFHSRFPEYAANDIADPAVIDRIIARGGLFNGGTRRDFDTALRDNLNPRFDRLPDGTGNPRHDLFGDDPVGDDSFQRLTYGGYRLQQGLSQSVPTRIAASRSMERMLLFDPFHPNANNGGVRSDGRLKHTAELDDRDFAANRAAFKEVGFSAGLNYNIYCNARVTLADGRVYVFGGHDMQSNNGLFKVQIFDPETETWLSREPPCTRTNWADPTNRPATGAFANCNAHTSLGAADASRTVTQPEDRSDMKYARWYPTAIPLPNNTILILGGPDQDERILPATNFATVGASDTEFNQSRTNQVVPEVYDPKSDRTIALENAPKTFPLYPQAEVVQFDRNGDGQFQRDDWKVCTMGGTERIANPFRGGDRYFGPFTGATWCLDVLAAMKDPNRDQRAAPADENKYWQQLDSASESRPYCCPTASLVELDRHGRTVSHRWYMISGVVAGQATATIEMLDFAAAEPRWRPAGSLTHPNNTGKVVLLPDGTIFFNNGLGLAGRPFPERAGLRYQIYDPVSEQTRTLALTTVPRGLHGTATLLPDATVIVAGENREALVRADDPAFTDPAAPLQLNGVTLTRGDPDLGVPNGQYFRPPYLFQRDGTRARRPHITRAPDELDYRGHFDVELTGSATNIKSVVLLRSDHNTHQLTTGDRYVKLAFQRKDHGHRGRVRVIAPRQPAQAVPGVYMLFLIDQAGVPSVGRQIRLMPDKNDDDDDEDD